MEGGSCGADGREGLGFRQRDWGHLFLGDIPCVLFGLIFNFKESERKVLGGSESSGGRSKKKKKALE